MRRTVSFCDASMRMRRILVSVVLCLLPCTRLVQFPMGCLSGSLDRNRNWPGFVAIYSKTRKSLCLDSWWQLWSD